MNLIKNFVLFKIKALSYFHKDSQKYRQRQVQKFLVNNLPFKINQSMDKSLLPSAEKVVVWIFWSQGFNIAPTFVKENLKHTERVLSSNYIVRSIDLKGLRELIDIPEPILSNYYSGKLKEAFFSDYVRFNLLAKFGGLWLDSTVYITQDEIPDNIKKANHFIFQDSDFNINNTDSWSTNIPGSSWLIYAKYEDGWAKSVSESLNFYCLNFNTVSYYYTTHLIMGLTFKLHPHWYFTMPDYDNEKPHRLQNLMSQPYNEILIDEALNSSFAHKLNYKQVYFSENDKQLFMNKLFK